MTLGQNVGTAERWGSAIAGAALALYGLTRRSGRGLGLALAGGLLVARGALGVSLLYRALGVDTARRTKRHAARTALEESVAVEGSPEELERRAGALAGEVRLAPLPGGRGTRVRLVRQDARPGGAIEAVAAAVRAPWAKLRGTDPQRQLEEHLRRFKQVAEAGEVATTAGQPAGRRGALARLSGYRNKAWEGAASAGRASGRGQ
jgi:uncharacterized membrane protein